MGPERATPRKRGGGSTRTPPNISQGRHVASSISAPGNLALLPIVDQGGPPAHEAHWITKGLTGLARGRLASAPSLAAAFQKMAAGVESARKRHGCQPVMLVAWGMNATGHKWLWLGRRGRGAPWPST